MAPGSQAPDDVPAGRSGGKILKAKRTAARKTPYDRPTQPQSAPPLLPPESPNWLSGLVSPAKFVAGGASKILSSFWNPKSWGTPSSSSSDSEFESEDSEDGEMPSDAEIEFKQQKGSFSQKSETLHLIEQLLMLEQYSREDCDRLIEIINSRVDYSLRAGAEAGPSMIRSSTDDETPHVRSQAIMEAKKWVAENKVRSGLKSDLDNGSDALKSVITPQATEVEAGSPIDVAKSYMKARPPWASPINYDNSLTASPLASDLLKERTPYSSGGGISFSSAKRDYLSAGSWNIQDEIRRVRSKATEDLLNSHRSVGLKLSTLEHDTATRSLANEKSMGQDEPITLGTAKSVNEIVNLATEEGSNPILSDMRTAQNEALPSHPTMPVLEQDQGIHSEKQKNTRSSSEGNGLEKEEDSSRQSDEKKVNQENGSISNDINNQVDKNCFLLTELPDVPLINSSQDSPNINDLSLAAKTDGITENQAVTTRGASRNTRKRERKR